MLLKAHFLVKNVVKSRVHVMIIIARKGMLIVFCSFRKSSLLRYIGIKSDKCGANELISARRNHRFSGLQVPVLIAVGNQHLLIPIVRNMEKGKIRFRN